MADKPTIETVADLEDLNIRVPPGRVSGLRGKHVRAAAVLAAATVGVALVAGLGIDFGGRGERAGREIEPPRGDLRPSRLNDLPASYDQIPAPAEPKRDGSVEAPSAPQPDALLALKQQNDELRQGLLQLSDSVKKVDGENKRLQGQLAKYEDEATKEQMRVWTSGLFFKLDERERDEQAAVAASSTPAGSWPDLTALAALTKGEPPASDTGALTQPPTNQQRKLAFLNQSSADGSHLEQPYLRPRSDYELQAGTVIPAALVTGINTDLPGDVIAAVTRPVYDSRTGRHLLIPQGAKLYGTYDSEIANGQNRALLVWHRLLMPNGRSIQLDAMKGTDAAGYAGVADKVDYHVDKLTAGVALSSVIAYAGNLARGGRSGGDEDARDVVGDTVAQEASRIGSKIIDRQLDVQPTITVRPGWPVHVLVDKDIVLSPYAN
jgi:type IV secretory pathway VirB10-like protein